MPAKYRNILMKKGLPNEIYNFLQTHLPDKRYSIVTELEKREAVKSQDATDHLIESKQQPQQKKYRLFPRFVGHLLDIRAYNAAINSIRRWKNRRKE